MPVEIYTDASYDDTKKIAVGACIILTQYSFLGMKTFTYEDVDDSTHAELLTIRDALKNAEELGVCVDKAIKLKTDSSSSVKLLRKVIVTPKEKHNMCVQEINELVKSMHVKFCVTCGHSESRNANNIVDFISKYRLRMKR